MSSDVARLVELSRRFVSSSEYSSFVELEADAWWLAKGVEVRELLAITSASHRTLKRAGDLFDAVAAKRTDDPLGEHIELCSSLAFVAWRHSCALGLEAQSALWTRITDELAERESALREWMESFLSLSDENKTSSLIEKFLGRPEDLFFALAVLRQARFSDNVMAFRGSAHIHRSLVAGVLSSFDDLSRTYFLGESALVAGLCGRNLGDRVYVENWLSSARTYFERLPAAKASIGRLELTLAMHERDLKEYDRAFQRIEFVLGDLKSTGMHREWLLGRLVVSICLKERGKLREAGVKLRILREDSRCAESSLHSCVLSYLGQVLGVEGKLEEAREVLEEAVEISRACGSRSMMALALASIAELAFARADWRAAVTALSAAVFEIEKEGESSFGAYYRVYLADALVCSRRFEEARGHLLIAIPILEDQGMVAEGLYAVKLLAEVEKSIVDAEESASELPTRIV